MVTSANSESTLPQQVSDLLLAVVFVTWPHLISFDTSSVAAILAFPAFIGLLFAPGYTTLIAVLSVDQTHGDPELPEILLLSFMFSVVFIPILGMSLHYAGFGADPNLITSLITGYTILVAATVAVARVALGRHTFGVSRTLTVSLSRLRRPSTQTDTILNLLLLIIIVVGAVVVVSPVPGQQDPRFTKLSLLTENESNTLVMDEYLTELSQNDSQTIKAGITNRENRIVNYTLIVQVQRTELNQDSVQVVARRTMSQTNVRVDAAENIHIPYVFTTTENQTGCRVVFLLYRNDVPANPTIENSYRETHLWHASDPPATGTTCPSLGALEVNSNGDKAQWDT